MTLAAGRRRNGILLFALVLGLACAPAIAHRPGWVIVAGLALCLLAAAIAVEDLARMQVPDELTIAVALLAAALAWGQGGWARLWPNLVEAGILALLLLLFSLLYAKMRGRTGLGLGDIKLLAASALLVGIAGVGFQILFACVAAMLFVLLRSIRRKRPLRLTSRIPFATFLAPALFIVWSWGLF